MTEKENAIYEFEKMATWCDGYTDDQLQAINYVRGLLHKDLIERSKVEKAIDDIKAEIDGMLSDGMVHKKTVLGIIDIYISGMKSED